MEAPNRHWDTIRILAPDAFSTGTTVLVRVHPAGMIFRRGLCVHNRYVCGFCFEILQIYYALKSIIPIPAVMLTYMLLAIKTERCAYDYYPEGIPLMRLTRHNYWDTACVRGGVRCESEHCGEMRMPNRFRVSCGAGQWAVVVSYGSDRPHVSLCVPGTCDYMSNRRRPTEFGRTVRVFVDGRPNSFTVTVERFLSAVRDNCRRAVWKTVRHAFLKRRLGKGVVKCECTHWW